MSALLDILRTASADEIVEVLMSLDAERPGLAYDVGMGLYERNPSKEFPGPAWDWYPTDPDGQCDVRLTGYDRERRPAAIRAIKDVSGFDFASAKQRLDALSTLRGWFRRGTRARNARERCPMRQVLLWVPGSPSVVDVDFDERPFRVWTVYSHMDPEVPPQLPLTPRHQEGFFLEDHVHDWVMGGRRRFRYFSRVVGRDEGVWLLLEWREGS